MEIRTVAVFGSIGAREIPLERLDRAMELRLRFLVRDAKGADLLVQRRLLERGYTYVVVYHNGARDGGPRHNLGGWAEVFVSGPYSAKDEAMCRDADCGLAFWNGVSRGTGRNIGQLRAAGRPVGVVRV